MPRLWIAACLAALALQPEAAAQGSPSPPGARVYIINLRDGDVVSSPVLVQFGLSGMGVSPAELDGGELTRNTGHHHLLINQVVEGEALRFAVPNDERHRHFGRGQTEAALTLPPGRHTLQLLLADWTHVPHDPPVMSERITITVR